jgi:hypothetical protein
MNRRARNAHFDNRSDARIIRFPLRAINAVIVCRERDGTGWLTIAGPHGWLFGSLAAARAEAHWLADNLGLPIREQDNTP